jgi:tartrate-resistant acid phosphatase type 5
MKRVTVIALYLLLFCSSISAQINFIAFGDWGREGKYLQQETADRMGIYGKEHEINFVITLGDNIYDYGVTGTDDPKWRTCFEDVYVAPALRVPWYASLGNHDYNGNVQAQIDYSNTSERWKMPARYYWFEKTVSGNVSALFVIIDTNPLIEGYRETKKNGTNDLFVDNINSQDPEKQIKWLDSVLAESNAKWKIVAGHHPIYSGGEHGNSADLAEKLEPVLEKNRVDMYMAGHDHDMQYLKKEGGTVNYFVAGSGSKLRETGKIEYTLFCKSINGFLGVKVTADNITADFVDYKGNVDYRTVIKK